MNGSSPTLVPYGADQTTYLVVDRLVASGSVDREIEVERSDLETIIDDLMSGQFNDPVRVIAFNTLEHWSEDMSADVAAEIQILCAAPRWLSPAARASIGLIRDRGSRGFCCRSSMALTFP